MASDRPDPIDEAHTHPPAVGRCTVAGKPREVVTLTGFYEADIRRATGFVTNFGTWTLPVDLAEGMLAPRGQLEWLHDTGELVLLGGVPQVGEAAIDVPEATATADTVTPGSFGGTAIVGRSDTPGVVREYFAEEQLPPDTRVLVLGRLAHGPRVHEVLWGWHERHRHADGWAWLTKRLDKFGDVARDDPHIF